MNPANPTTAFGAPVLEPRWASSAKDGMSLDFGERFQQPDEN
jgi:hypothetical protein